MENQTKRVVIVGGGFAGLNAARALGGRDDVRVTLVDRRNHHLFQPLLYQVAMAALSPADIAVPIRGILYPYENVDVMLAEVTDLDLQKRSVSTSVRDLEYDYLILACGATHSYFGREDWEDFAPGLKSVEEATEIRRRVLTAFERAEHETDPERQREWLTFVVVGAGPTGVELAGALGEISRYTLARDFRKIDPKRTRVILIEGGGRVLPTFDEDLSAKAARGLEKLGVTVWTSCLVSGMGADWVAIGNETIHARTILWAAGVKPSPLNSKLGAKLGPAGRVIVDSDLSVPGHPEVFVLGDQANFQHGQERPLPGVAFYAIQQGRHAARNILRELSDKKREPFKPKDKGMMATIGRAFAVVQSHGIKFSGFTAWLAWLLVHIFYLIGFRNRVVVIFQWAWSYMTFRRGSRLITNRDWHSTAFAATQAPKPARSAKKKATSNPRRKKVSAKGRAKKGRA